MVKGMIGVIDDGQGAEEGAFHQGDQIGRIFAYGPLFSLGSIF
jgi:hypothetical protein